MKNPNNNQNNFLPAEWHKQSGVQLTWPHANSDWAPYLDEAEQSFINIAREIAKREKLLVVTPSIDKIQTLLSPLINMENVRFVECQTNDTWARDHGAISVFKDGKACCLDFAFNGWGLKFKANFDNLITKHIFSSGAFSPHIAYENRLNFILEGGSIESDGEGTILTTSECLLSPNRNGEWSRDQIENYLKEAFFAKQILWVDNGYLAGDDTDSHIDTLARLCPNDTIAYVKCDDQNDEHYQALKRMEEELQKFKTLSGKAYRLIALPMADAVYYDGERLPATYANFLIINGAVLVPTYNQTQNDALAIKALQSAFPEHEIVGIDCSVLIRQHGSLHCVTMQYPEGIME